MSKRDDISSTAKLLEVIRGESSDTIDTGAQPVVDAHDTNTLLPGRVLPFSKMSSVGVVIGHDAVVMVAATRLSDQKWRLNAIHKYPLKPGMGRGKPGFANFLKDSLTQFCHPLGKTTIWSTVSSAQAEIRIVSIPKVPEKQIANAAFWTFKKQVPFDERDVIFDYDVLGESTQDGKPRIDLLAFVAPRSEVAALQNLFADIGFSLTGISIVPFALQNLLRTGVINHKDTHSCSLYIGQDWSRIDIFLRGNLVLSRDIKTGMNSFIEVIRLWLDRQAAGDEGDGDELDSEITEQTGSLEPDTHLEKARALFAFLIHPHQRRGDSDDIDGYREEDIAEIISPVLERLIRQVERTMGHFSLNFNNQSVSTIFLGGDVSGEHRLLGLMRDSLFLPIHRVDPFDCAVLSVRQITVPVTHEEKDAYVPAVGIALSTNDITPNFLYTFRHKTIQKKIEWTNRMIFSVFIVLMVVIAGFYFWQQFAIEKKRTEAARIDQELLVYSPRPDKLLIEQLAGKITAEKNKLRQRSQHLLGRAVIAEIVGLTPEHIRLTTLAADLRTPAKKVKQVRKSVTLEGVVLSMPDLQESELAVYVLKLNNSPLIKQTTVTQKKVKSVNQKTALHFSIRLELI